MAHTVRIKPDSAVINSSKPAASAQFERKPINAF